MTVRKAFNYLITVLFCLISSFSTLAVMSTPEQQKAKEQGIIYFHQYKTRLADEMLQIPAEAGDVESMFYLGMTLRIRTDFNANMWLEKAAEAGDIYAMYQLTQGMPAWNIVPGMENQDKAYWQAKGEALALERAKQGDLESMYIYYRFTGNIEWLEKAANAGWADAQEMLSSAISKGEKSYERLSRKQRDVLRLKWLMLSANNGNPVAGHKIFLHYQFSEGVSTEEFAVGRAYLLKAVEHSYIDAIEDYVRLIISDPSASEEDLIKTYMFTLLLEDVTGTPGYMDVLTDGHLNYPHIKPLTPEQIEQALVLKEQWVKSHPPLTRYLSKMKIIGDMFSY